MMEEVNMRDYIPLKNFEHLYFINGYGIIKKKKTPLNTTEDACCSNLLKVIEPRIKGNYEIVYLKKDGIRTEHTTHRLIAETFIPNPDNLPRVLHINRDGFDNRIENLRWVSIKDYYPSTSL